MNVGLYVDVTCMQAAHVRLLSFYFAINVIQILEHKTSIFRIKNVINALCLHFSERRILHSSDDERCSNTNQY